MLVTFDSLPEFIQCVRTKVERPLQKHSRDAWYGYVSFDEAIEKTLHGDSRYVQEAMTLIDQLDLAMPETKMFRTIASPYGGRCNFGDWQTGSPTPMRRRVRATTDYGPLKVIVATTCSQGITANTMRQRGAAILALLLKLQELRPVELYLLAEMFGCTEGWHYQLIRVESKPLDTSIAGFVLANVGFARHLTYELGRVLDNFNGSWPSDYRQSDYASRRRERLNLQDDDIVIPEVYITDTLVTQPIKWITERLAQYGVKE